MKYYFFILLIIITSSCKKEVKPSDEIILPQIATLEKGQQLFQENNCVACHQSNQKVVGPSLEQIAIIYKKQNANIASFLKEEAEPIVDPAMYESMKINLQITKTMTNEELQSLELYILSHSK